MLHAHVPVPFALTTHDVDEAIFHVASALQTPVLILALAALALVLYELGRYAIERNRRRRRTFTQLDAAATGARAALLAGDPSGAKAAVAPITNSGAMAATMGLILTGAREPHGDHRLNKALADFDLDSQRRLGTTRMLVRAGPALGLMGTLIPLSPALTGLARGDTATLATDLRIAFSITVLGLLVGAVAFGISLSRDRMYGQDLSDLEYVAAVVSDPHTETAHVGVEPAAVVAPPGAAA
jgi:biopolymer transport protein ExbB/TolQ